MGSGAAAARRAITALPAVLLAVGALLSAALPARAADKPPLVLAKSGYLYTGGQIDEAAEGHPMVGHLYAEFMIPAKVTHPYPIVMVPGGSQTGTNFTGTIAGDEGWAQYFARRGYAVYVVDQVARGRSAYWAPVYGPLAPANPTFMEQRFIAPERFKLWPQAHLHSQFPGAGTPGDPYFLAFMATQFPSLADFGAQQKVNTSALVALLDKLGPAILLTHSQSGAFGWPVADQRPNLVKAIVAIEPSGPPMHDIAFGPAPDWFKDVERTKVSGLGDVPLTYDPPLAPGAALDVVRQDQPDKPDFVRCWAQKAPARQLPNLRKIPVLIIIAEASYHAPYDHCTAAWLKDAGVRNTMIRLADVGIHGNGHMMMVEKNSDAIAAVIANWLATNAPAKERQSQAC
jgi:pimeloyl-ACP methyl ester carboxylesterase